MLTKFKGITIEHIEAEMQAMAEYLDSKVEEEEGDATWSDVKYVGLRGKEYFQLNDTLGTGFSFEEPYDCGGDGQLYHIEESPQGYFYAASCSVFEEDGSTVYGKVPLSEWLCQLLGISPLFSAPWKYTYEELPELVQVTETVRVIRAEEVEIMDDELAYPANSAIVYTSETVDQVLRAAYVRQELALLYDKTKMLSHDVFGYEGDDDINW